MHPMCYTVHQNIAVGMKFGIFTAIELVAMYRVEKVNGPRRAREQVKQFPTALHT